MRKKMKVRATFSISNEALPYSKEALSDIFDKIEKLRIVKDGNKIEYFDIPSSFDIETTSYTAPDGKKNAWMYEWTFGIFGYVLYGREWSEFEDAMSYTAERLGLCKERRLVCYVHNLAFEFQFIRHRLEWESVFAMDDRKPVKALSTLGIEFRCSMILSGYSLETLGQNLVKYPVQKMVGDLDYSLIRHSGTPLTEKEIGYCVNDVKVVMSYIQEKIEEDGDITRIPLTKTGYVRRFVRNYCFYDKKQKNRDKYIRYAQLMRSLTLDPDEYLMLKRGFQGGFTHCNGFFHGRTVEKIQSWDICSSYPAIICSERFPMSKGERITVKSYGEFIDNCKVYACLFDIEFIGLESVVIFDHYISSSRCRILEGAVEDNGRVVSADRIRTTMTEQDFFIVKKFYKWKKMRVGTFIRYRKSYLPRDFVRAVLDLYGDKTSLKGVPGKEIVYMKKKEGVNSAFGMCVTDIVRDEIVYEEDDWQEARPPDLSEAIDKYNKAKNRFLFYPWGVWITAYARRRLFSAIWECGGGVDGDKIDYLYSDTDSVKIRNGDDHRQFFDKFNEYVKDRTEKCLTSLGIDPELSRPKTVKGVEKPLGVFEYECTYDRFRTLGAKRYMTEEDGKLSITVSGLNKRTVVPWLVSEYGDKVFDAFDENLYIPDSVDPKKPIFDAKGIPIKNPTGKNIHTYLDYPQEGEIVDYLGIPGRYSERSSVHLCGADYSLSLSRRYADYLLGIKEKILI